VKEENNRVRKQWGCCASSPKHPAHLGPALCMFVYRLSFLHLPLPPIMPVRSGGQGSERKLVPIDNGQYICFFWLEPFWLISKENVTYARDRCLGREIKGHQHLFLSASGNACNSEEFVSVCYLKLVLLYWDNKILSSSQVPQRVKILLLPPISVYNF
jgi:hypothetical protein